MKSINIFRAGRHIAASGDAIEFTESDLQAAANAYDPAKHEAPIVVGHPKDNAPAFGWVSALSFAEASLDATPHQLDPEFAELVSAGRYKKVSASFYTPDSPTNPVPGVYYLRHVGFLGAQPPAVKGLRGIEFAEEEEGVLMFDEWSDSTNASLWRKLREFVISKFSIEDADTVVPDYAVRDLEAAAARKLEAPQSATIPPAFSEGTTPEAAAMTMTPEQIEAAKAELEAKKAEQAAKDAEFAEREAKIRDREAKAAQAENKTFVDGLVAEGKLLPAQQETALAFMCALPGDGVVEFGEGEGKTSKPMLEAFKTFLAAQPKLVEYSERAGENADGEQMTAVTLADKARKLAAEARAAGTPISFAEAVRRAGEQKAA